MPGAPGSKVKVAVSGQVHQEPWSSQVPIERVTLRTMSGPAGVALGDGAAVGAAEGAAVGAVPGGAVAGGLVLGGGGAEVDGVRTTGAWRTAGGGAGAAPPGDEGRTALAPGACEESGAKTIGAGEAGSSGTGCIATPPLPA